MAIETLIVCGQRLCRESLRCLLEQDREIEVIGEAAGGYEAYILTAQKAPHLILMDLNLPGLDGVQTTVLLSKRSPRSKVLLLGEQADKVLAASALKAGAAGYVLKAVDRHEFLRIIKSVAKGESAVSPFLATKQATPFTTPIETETSRKRGSVEGHTAALRATLTKREVEVLDLALQGASNRAIAERLGVSPDTINTHLKHLYRKLNVVSRVELLLQFFSKTSE